MTTISVTPNHSKRTFTIRKKDKAVTYAKFRSLSLSKEEFESLLYNTEDDWKDYLRYNEVIVLK